MRCGMIPTNQTNKKHEKRKSSTIFQNVATAVTNTLIAAEKIKKLLKGFHLIHSRYKCFSKFVRLVEQEVNNLRKIL